MGEFVDAYSKATGRKQRIPAHWLGIPSFAAKFRKTPTQRRDDGELDLKGKALDDALDAAGLPKSGTADEKRERLDEYLSDELVTHEEVNAVIEDAPDVSKPTDPLETNDPPHGGETKEE